MVLLIIVTSSLRSVTETLGIDAIITDSNSWVLRPSRCTQVWSAHFGIYGDAQRLQSYISKAWLLWLKDPNVLMKKAP